MELKDLAIIAMLFLVAGVGMGIGAEVVDTFATKDRTNILANVTNETWTASNVSASLAQQNISSFGTVTNASNVEVAPGNYSVSLVPGTIALTENTRNNNSWAATGADFNLDYAGILSLQSVRNASNTVVDATNYTITIATGVIKLNGGSEHNGTTLNVSYTYNQFNNTNLNVSYNYDTLVDNYTQAGSIANNASLGLEEMASWFDTLALVLAAAIILGVLMTAFWFSRR
jgi:hypothetical protein